jgi:hypothetical protein
MAVAILAFATFWALKIGTGTTVSIGRICGAGIGTRVGGFGIIDFDGFEL